MIISYKLLTIWIIPIIYSILIKGLSCLRIKQFQVPRLLSAGDSGRFICDYELDYGDRLYSLKWYKNETEFYRYIPHSFQKIQLFPMPEIPLELPKSVNGTTIVISDVIPETSGNYKCELSAEGSFLTVHREQMLIVTDGSISLHWKSYLNLLIVNWLMISFNCLPVRL
ncbi:uncharacterized protein LOC128391165 [Panonychus citri]|uniref:uncharacterized protein LOC128391165 n=1 Tax=Panonychus citri TaxID=50023 RepID=UPI00230762CA|nr:uncharacterized protein LOC128391165 [Panonychus citri]